MKYKMLAVKYVAKSQSNLQLLVKYCDLHSIKISIMELISLVDKFSSTSLASTNVAIVKHLLHEKNEKQIEIQDLKENIFKDCEDLPEEEVDSEQKLTPRMVFSKQHSK